MREVTAFPKNVPVRNCFMKLLQKKRTQSRAIRKEAQTLFFYRKLRCNIPIKKRSARMRPDAGEICLLQWKRCCENGGRSKKSGREGEQK